MEELIESNEKIIEMEKEIEFLRDFEHQPFDEYVTRGEVAQLMKILLRYIENKK